jgi:hypothetical protein
MTGASFNGTHASKYWMPAYFEAETISSGVVSMWDGIKDKVNISNMVFAGGLQPRQETPNTPYGTVTVAEKILEPAAAMLYLIYNPAKLENQWESAKLSTKMLDRNLPNEFSSYFMYSVMSSVFGQDMEVGWWMSSLGYTVTDTTDPLYKMQYCDGFMKRLVNDATVLNYASPATITTSNILAMLDGLLDLITTNKKALVQKSKKKRMKYFFSALTMNIWRKFLVAAPYKGIEFSDATISSYAGFDIVELSGFPDNTILFCEGTKDQMGALHIGMNSTEDDNSLQTERTRPQDETFFVKALMKFSTQIKFGNEMALTTTYTASYFTN